jgi:3-deoxy-D-arabino-heptulosonate 7-phosphate (DAHP) synthase
MGVRAASKLSAEIQKHAKELLVIMRVYFEKPRTTVGWKGLINDPALDGTYQINKGLKIARDVNAPPPRAAAAPRAASRITPWRACRVSQSRAAPCGADVTRAASLLLARRVGGAADARAAAQLLVSVNEMGVPAGTEFLDTISPQYTADTIAWGAIGARTTESQLHRELASGLSCPIGFKNGTSGAMQIAIDAIRSSSCPHYFMGVTNQGLAGIVGTKGNPYCHVIHRGGADGPNYSKEHVTSTAALLTKSKLPVKVMIDCSHANSSKKHKNQIIVAKDIADQLAAGGAEIFGVMIESNLSEGRQDLIEGQAEKLEYGVSITDACVDWATTEQMLQTLADGVKARRAKK